MGEQSHKHIRASGSEDLIFNGSSKYSPLAIAEATHRVLRPGGTFLIYQYSAYVVSLVEPLFESIDRDRQWWNVPPCGLFWAHKAAEE